MIYKKTMDLRWKKVDYYTNPTIKMNLCRSTYSDNVELQQRWENIQTGESKWEPITKE